MRRRSTSGRAAEGAPARLRLTPGERMLASLLTGPLGHLYAALADLLVLAARHLPRIARSRASASFRRFARRSAAR